MSDLQPGQRLLNVPGLVSLILAGAGVLLGCVPIVRQLFPLAWVAGMILLPVAFILAIVSLFLKNRGKALGIAGLIVSVLGSVIAAILFVELLRETFGPTLGEP